MKYFVTISEKAADFNTFNLKYSKTLLIFSSSDYENGLLSGTTY